MQWLVPQAARKTLVGIKFANERRSQNERRPYQGFEHGYFTTHRPANPSPQVHERQRRQADSIAASIAARPPPGGRSLAGAARGGGPGVVFRRPPIGGPQRFGPRHIHPQPVAVRAAAPPAAAA